MEWVKRIQENTARTGSNSQLMSRDILNVSQTVRLLVWCDLRL
jgi:hypothetical protein